MDLFTPLTVPGASVPVTRDLWLEPWPEVVEVRKALGLPELKIPHFPLHLLLSGVLGDSYAGLRGVADAWTGDLLSTTPSPVTVELAKALGAAADQMAAMSTKDAGDEVMSLLVARVEGADMSKGLPPELDMIRAWATTRQDGTKLEGILITCLYYFHKTWLLSAAEYGKAALWSSGVVPGQALGALAPAAVLAASTTATVAKIRKIGLRSYV